MSGQEALLVFFIFGGGYWVLRPLVGALAKRVAGETRRVATPDELATLRADLLAERVDFTERVIARQREAERLPPAGR